MKRIFPNFLLFVFLFGSLANASAQQSGTKVASDSIQKQRFNLGFGLSIMNLDYKEILTAPHKSTESGYLPGLFGNLRCNFPSGWAIQGNLTYHFGDEDYDGSTQDGVPMVSKTNSKFLNLAGLGGYKFQIDPVSSFEIRSGLALKFWRRTLDDEYVEDYTRIAIPVEGELAFLVGAKNKLKFFIATDIMISGGMDLDFYGTSVDVTLGNELGYRLGAAFEAPLSERLSFNIGLQYEHFEFGKSDNAVMYYNGSLIELYEPASKTNNFYINLGLGIKLN